jgi:ribosomal-protein-alanine acetyltransferase
LKDQPDVPGLTTREFEPTDASTAHALAASSPGAGQWSSRSYERLREEGLQGWVAESGGAVCGFLVVRILSPEMEILNVVVSSQQRRKGIAAALFSVAEKEAREKKVGRVFLEVRESNAAAISFYKRYGFRKMGFRVGYYADPVESALLMEKDI